MQLVSDAVDHRGLGRDRQLVVLGHRPQLGRGLDHDLADVGRTPRVLTPRIRARQQQQVTDQPAHSPSRTQRRLGRLRLLAVELLGEQVEVRQHARQRRPQLVRGVGDELALAIEHRLGIRLGSVERRQHALQRVRQLGDLVFGLGVGEAKPRITGAADLPRRRGQLLDRRHRPLGHEQAGQQRQYGAAEHSEQQEDLHAGERLVDRVLRDRVQQRDQVVARLQPHMPLRHQVAGFAHAGGC